MTASDAIIYEQLALVPTAVRMRSFGSNPLQTMFRNIFKEAGIKHIPYFKANYIKIFSEKLCLYVFFRLSGLNSFAKVNFHSASPM